MRARAADLPAAVPRVAVPLEAGTVVEVLVVMAVGRSTPLPPKQLVGEAVVVQLVLIVLVLLQRR